MSKENTISDLEQLKKELLDRVKQVDITINTLRTISMSGSIDPVIDLSTSISNDYKDYDINASFRNKIAYVLNMKGRFLHVREIAKILHDIEPKNSIEDLIKKISPAISSLGQAGTIVKIKSGKSNINTFWGSKSWLDDNNKPKEGREYDNSYTIKASNSEIKIE
jgi:hypothetical protein